MSATEFERLEQNAKKLSEFARIVGKLSASGVHLPSTVSSSTEIQETNELEASQLRVKYAALQKEGKATKEELKQVQSQYADTQQFGHLLNRVDPIAHPILRTKPEFVRQFQSADPVPAYVMSIDIRRSTELMLKAREPKLFAQFVTDLCTLLRHVILDHLGVFDKFTGDGILAFFPEFYSGSDAGMRVIQAADMCHRVFEKHYRESRKCFTAVLLDTGLGIGIDYGQVQLVQVGGDLTVVGNPVVYACRMGGADPGKTLLNQPAYDAIFESYSAYCHFTETKIAFKHEGEMAAYEASCNGKQLKLKPANWQCGENAEPDETADDASKEQVQDDARIDAS